MNFRYIGYIRTRPILAKLLDAEKSPANLSALAEPRIRRLIVEDITANRLPLKLGDTERIWPEHLTSNHCEPWQRDEREDADKILRFVLALETNPLVRLTVGGQDVHMEAGTLWWVQQRLLSSWQNLGKHAAIHLFAEFRLVEAGDDRVD